MMLDDLFPGFETRRVATPRGEVFARVAGDGPALLLLHGYPQNHLMWHAVAPTLAARCTVVAADLPGYGDSFRPAPAGDHRPHAKRTLAADLVDLMHQLGHEQFLVAGHDRGGRVAYRMALDHPDRIRAAAVIDVVPTSEVWAQANAAMALTYWHWGFLAQPAPLPERMIRADPDAFFDFHVRRLGLGAAPGRYPDALMKAYRRFLHDPGIVEAICEDYRAGATTDRTDDEDDRGRRRIRCPLLVLWSATGALPHLYDDVLAVWRPWAADLRGWGVLGSHFLVEDRPDQVASALTGLLDRLTHDPAPDRTVNPPSEPVQRPTRPRGRSSTRNEAHMSATPSPAAASAPDALASGLRRTEIQHHPSSFPGRDIVQVRTEIPVGVASGWHTHPGEEIGYIVDGTVRMEVDGQTELLLHAGDGFLIPPGTPHNAHDLGPGTGVMLSTYLVDPAAPLSSFVDPPRDLPAALG